MQNKYTFATLFLALILFGLLAGAWLLVQCSAAYMNHNLVWGPLEISLILLLGGTMFGALVILWTRAVETFPLKLLTTLTALRGFVYCLDYWRWPMQSLTIFCTVALVWLSWSLWLYRNTKDQSFLKWLIFGFAIVLIVAIAVGIVGVFQAPQAITQLLAEPENYDNAAFLTGCLFVSSLNVVILESAERWQSKATKS